MSETPSDQVRARFASNLRRLIAADGRSREAIGAAAFPARTRRAAGMVLSRMLGRDGLGPALVDVDATVRVCRVLGVDAADLFAAHAPAEVGAEFRRLRDVWHAETKHLSNAQAMLLHPAYQAIIGLGRAVVPHILADMRDGPDHWGWALRAITQHDPVPYGCEGDVAAIADAWLAWGREQGLISPD